MRRGWLLEKRVGIHWDTVTDYMYTRRKQIESFAAALRRTNPKIKLRMVEYEQSGFQEV